LTVSAKVVIFNSNELNGTTALKEAKGFLFMNLTESSSDKFLQHNFREKPLRYSEEKNSVINGLNNVRYYSVL
jgi:hypothetical protein